MDSEDLAEDPIQWTSSQRQHPVSLTGLEAALILKGRVDFWRKELQEAAQAYARVPNEQNETRFDVASAEFRACRLALEQLATQRPELGLTTTQE